LEIGAASYHRTKQNLAVAFAFNGVGIPAAATGLVHPVWAMAAMVTSVSAVLLNSFGIRVLAPGTWRAFREPRREEEVAP
jgi:cation transport ATPase